MSLLLAMVAMFILPHRIAEMGAGTLMEPGGRRALAEGVAHWVEQPLAAGRFATGSTRFDAEWLFGTYMMASMGFSQEALQSANQAEREKCLERSRLALEKLFSVEARAFDSAAWTEDPLASLSGSNGHAAYLGYLNLAISVWRLAHERSDMQDSLLGRRLVEWNDEISSTLTRRLAEEPRGLLETYPGEIYPVDNALGVASIAIAAQARGEAVPSVVVHYMDLLRAKYIDPSSGLLVQSTTRTGEPHDRPRGSGTMLLAYAFSFVDSEFSRAVWRKASAELYGTTLGFGMMREYARNSEGHGDIDSGPVILGYGISSTGFAIASALRFGDTEMARSLLATAWMFGVPVRNSNVTHFAMGGPIGDAILFAMMSVPRGHR